MRRSNKQGRVFIAAGLLVAGINTGVAGETSPAADSASESGDADEQHVELRRFDIPKRDHGYHQFDTQLLTSPAELDDFLKEIVQQTSWWDREAFIATLRSAEIDFAKASLLLLRHTEGSGSVRVRLEPAVVVGDELVLRVTREAPAIGTMDMAYYCFALEIPNACAPRVRITGGSVPSKSAKNEDGEPIVTPAREDDIVIELGQAECDDG